MTFPLMPIPQVNSSSPTMTFTTAATNASNLITYTFTAMAIGAASPDRRVIVAMHTDLGSLTPVSVTIGGIAATAIKTTDGLGVFMAFVPTGTTADVVVTWSGTAARCAIGVWSVQWAGRGVTASTLATGTSAASSVAVANLSGGVVIVASTHAGGTGLTYSGGPTENYDTVNGNATRYSGANQSNIAVAGTVTSTATNSGSFAWRMIAVALR